MNAVWASMVLALGSFFCLLAAVGMLRLPDTLIRMHAATKAGTLGAGLVLLADALYFAETGITLRALAAVAFVLLTAPVAAHLIGRAAYHQGIRLYGKTWIDELQRDRENRPIDGAAAETEKTSGIRPGSDAISE
jgi:multicomponent Na+:H+ antiporter subunit G